MTPQEQSQWITALPKAKRDFYERLRASGYSFNRAYDTVHDTVWVDAAAGDDHTTNQTFQWTPTKRGAEGKFARIAQEIADLLAEKRVAYGASFEDSGKVMALLYPNGISLDQYQDALTVIRIIDKLFRIATDKDALGESPYRDIAGYGILGAADDEESSNPKVSKPEPSP